jgi:hypothetical protein
VREHAAPVAGADRRGRVLRSGTARPGFFHH